MTDVVTAGQTATVVVGVTDKVNNPSIASWYAQHNIGGINRSVELLALDKSYIKRLYVETELDKQFQNAELILTTELAKDEGKAGILEISVKDDDRTLVTGEIEVAAGETIAKKSFAVTAPKLWDAEHPNLYELTATLKIDGVAVQTNTQKIGFREFTFSGADGTEKNKIYVNGKEVKLRGTCRHDVSYRTGRATSPEEDRNDIEVFKKHNINFIRTSHYPPSKDILEACDELGIYVLEETAVCFQGFDNNPPKTTEADYLNQFTEMVERDRNHASILVWSLGNESWGRWTDAFQTEARYIADVDTTRPTMFSYPWTDNAPETDIYSTHYAPWNGDYSGWAPYGGIPKDLDRPLLHDEYTHVACYDTAELMRDPGVRNFWGESLKRFWERIFVTDGELGGALWGGVDDVFYLPDGVQGRHQFYSKGAAVGYGEWGSVLDAYHRLKPEAYLVKKAYSPIRLQDREVECPEAGQPLTLEIKNWFDHTDLSEVRMVYSINGEASVTVNALPALAPHKTGRLTLPARDWQPGDTVRISFYTTYDGLEVDSYEVLVGTRTVQFAQASETAPTVTESGNLVTIAGAGFSVVFDKAAAQLTSAVLNGRQLLSGGPTLHVTGLPLGNWEPAAENAFAIRSEGGQALVTLQGSFGQQGVRFDIAISSNGRMETTYTLTTAPAKGTGLSEVGVSYTLSGEVKSVDWLRDSLWSAYPEGHLGRTEGTAARVRESGTDQYGVKPSWDWEQDMRNFYLYQKDSKEDGLVTNDFKSMRENIYYYNVNFTGTDGKVQVESDGTDAARVSVGYSQPLTVDDSEVGKIKYEGTGWGHSSGSGFYADTQSYSQNAGDTCSLEFEGTGIRLLSSKQSNSGQIKVYIDGVLTETIDTYNGIGAAMPQSIVFTKTGLANRSHTIKLEVVGGTGDSGFTIVDAFQILTGEDDGGLVSTLIVNNDWNYPELGWKNYERPMERLGNGSTGKVVIRLTNKDDFVVGASKYVIPPTVSSLNITEANSTLTAACTVEHGDAELSQYQWMQRKTGDINGAFVPIPGETGKVLRLGDMPAGYDFLCQVTPVSTDTVGEPERSEAYTYAAKILDDRDLSIKYPDNVIQDQGGYLAGKPLYQESLSYVKNGVVTLTFTGTGIRWLGHHERNHGESLVTVDSEEPVRVDQYEDATNYNSTILFERVNLPFGTHTIQLKNVANAFLSVDAFVVIGNAAEDVTGIKVMQGSTEIKNGDTIKVYTNEDHPNHSTTLTAEVTPADVSNKALNWTRPAGAEGRITLERGTTESGGKLTITAVPGEKNVGEVEVEVAYAANPNIKVTFKVQVVRLLEHDVSISIQGVNDPRAVPKFGQTLEADINQLQMTDHGKTALSYQWKRDGTNISGATQKTYTLTEEDIGAKISVDVIAAPSSFYEGTRSATREQAVDKADGPSTGPQNLVGTESTALPGNGTITGFGGNFRDYEYKLAADSEWKDVTGSTITGLAPGNYQVRAKETKTHYAGASVTVTVTESGKDYYNITLDKLENGNVQRSASAATAGTKITLTITPGTGYMLDTLAVTDEDGNAVNLEGTNNIRTFTMPDKHVTVAAVFKKWKLTIDHSGLEHLRCSLGTADSHEVEYGEKASIRLIPDEGYRLPDRNDIRITNDRGDAITGWTISDDGTISITGGVTSNLTVTAIGVRKVYAVNYTLTNSLSSPSDRTVQHGSAYTGKLQAEGTTYRLPASISITMDGRVFTDFTYDAATGTITIAAGKITGNVVITAAGVTGSDTPITPIDPVTPGDSGEDNSRKPSTRKPSSGKNNKDDTSKPGRADEDNQLSAPELATPSVPATNFTDVRASDWFQTAIHYVSANGIMIGNAGRFSPNDTLTRSMAAQILFNLDKANGSYQAAFPDVTASDWFAQAVAWASQTGVMSGYSNGRFGPNDSLTREQLAVILYRYAMAKGWNGETANGLAGFTDSTSVSDWAETAVSWAVANGLLSGKSNGMLDPAGKATRAEVAQVLMNFLKNIAE